MGISPSEKKSILRAVSDLRDLQEKVDNEQNEKIEALGKRIAKIEELLAEAD